jgi:sirohydrochlorin cobaltochelatase
MIGDYTGVLLIAHGMREEQGRGAFSEIVDFVRQLLPGLPVEGAFLEFASPTLAEAISKLAGQGGNRLAAVPMFLSAFGHTRNDIPAAIGQAIKEGSGFRVQDSGFSSQWLVGSDQRLEVRGQRSEVRDMFSRDPQGSAPRLMKHGIALLPPVGAHRRVVELSALRYRQALEGKTKIPAEETLLVIAAHGSTEPGAIEELTDFAARRKKLTPIAEVIPCFAVLGKPQLSDVLSGPFKAPYNRIVVQPHLLLRGRFHDSICNLIKTHRQKHPNIDWIVTEPLGPDKLLAQAVAEIMNA